MSREERSEAREDVGRRQRVPLGGHRQKLQAKQHAGFHRRWFNDVDTRLLDAKGAGYDYVRDEKAKGEDGTDSRLSRVVGVKEDGSPMRAFLMEIRQDWYDEDQAAKQKLIDETDSAIRRGNVRGANPKDRSSYYVPSEGISVRTD